MAGCERAHIPHRLFPAIRDAVVSQSLAATLHWLRIFVSNVNGEFTFEVLLDNEEWPAGVDAMKSLPWEQSNGYYSVRHFLVIRPA
jgi:hypothetical protein